MRLYTRGGDGGKTSVPGKGRVSKAHPRLEAAGALDELNSTLGAALALLPALRRFAGLRRELDRVQSELLWAGALLAYAPGKPPKPHAPPLDPSRLEREIDSLCAGTPPLTRLILPGGSAPGAFLHLARCACRRAERSAAVLGREAPAEVLAYLNRLSDYLFAAARWTNASMKAPEKAWTKGR